MTITFVCRATKVSKKDGLTPLELYVIINGKRRFVSLNRRIDPKLFNPKKQIVRGDDQAAPRVPLALVTSGSAATVFISIVAFGIEAVWYRSAV